MSDTLTYYYYQSHKENDEGLAVFMRDAWYLYIYGTVAIRIAPSFDEHVMGQLVLAPNLSPLRWALCAECATVSYLDYLCPACRAEE